MALVEKVTYWRWSLSVVIWLLMDSCKKGKEDWNLSVAEYQRRNWSMTGRQRAGLSLDVTLLVWRLRVVLESEGTSENFSFHFLFVLPRPPAATTAILLLAFNCSLFLSDPRQSTARGKGNELWVKVSCVVVCSCWYREWFVAFI